MLILLFVSLPILKVGGTVIVNPQGPTVVKDITECINRLIEINFVKSGLLYFANTSNFSTSVGNIRDALLKKINENTKFSVKIITPSWKYGSVCDENVEYSIVKDKKTGQFDTILMADYYVIVIDYYEDFTNIAKILLSSYNWNPHASFLIALLNFTRDKKENVKHAENIINCLFKFQVLNVVVIIPKTDNVRDAIVYGWRPYDPPKYCGDNNETARKRSTVKSICERGILKQGTNLFNNDPPNDMKGCVLKILALERQPFISENLYDANIERVLFDEIVKTFNFTSSYVMAGNLRGEKSDGEWGGALKAIVTKQAQILLGGIFPDTDIHDDFDCSTSYLADSYTWVVPRAYQSPPWTAFIVIFQQIVWVSAIVGFVISVITWKILGVLNDDSSYYTYFDHCLLNTWLCTLGLTTYLRPIKDSLRVFFVFFNLYCVLFITAYQTKLFDVLTNPSFEHQVATIEELLNTGLKIGGYEELHDLFVNSSDYYDNIITTEWINVDNITKAMLDVVVHRNFSLLCSRLELTHISANMPELSDSFGRYKYYDFDRNVFTIPMEMVSLRGFAFTRKFSKTLEIFKQSGIMTGIRRYFTAFTERKKASLLRNLENSKRENALSIQHLQGGFLAVTLGYVCGILVFVIEVLIESDMFKNKLAQWKSNR